MIELLQHSLSHRELIILSSIVQVGDATYKDLMESHEPMFGHRYFADTRGKIRTKLVQMQCEIESHDPDFPFDFTQRNFSYEHCIPELHTKNMILHIGRSPAPDILPYEAKYKIQLSHNNALLDRQMVIDPDIRPPFGFGPFYGLLVFGGRNKPFITVQFPAPGYRGILDSIDVPRMMFATKSAEAEVFERKKAGLKKEFLARGLEGVIS